MFALQRQFLISFGVMGSVLAYLPVFLLSRLDSAAQVGIVMSTTGIAVVLTPVLITALADTRLQSRSLIAALFAVAALTCFWQAESHSFTALLISHTVFAFFIWPITSLQDGLVFAANQQARIEGKSQTPYHRVRVFGTIGFALPLAGLYFLLEHGFDVSIALKLGGVICAIGAVNALTLPHIGLSQARKARFDEVDADKASTRFPTLAAARVLFKGPALIFCICLFIAHVGNSAYYAFYPLYLTETVGFAQRWVGPITMLGVVLELGMMAAVGLMLRRLGLKRLMIFGLSLMVLRFVLLGVWPSQHMAVWTQVLHGMTVIAIYVLPPSYLNALAGDHFRSSIQGLYAMAVFGPSRIAGNVLGGVAADVSYPMLFIVCACTTATAVVGLAIGMRAPGNEIEEARDVPALVEGD